MSVGTTPDILTPPGTPEGEEGEVGGPWTVHREYQEIQRRAEEQARNELEAEQREAAARERARRQLEIARAAAVSGDGGSLASKLVCYL